MLMLEKNHVFVGESEAVRVDNGVDEPVQLLQHPLVCEHGVDGPQRSGRTDPLSCVNPFKEIIITNTDDEYLTSINPYCRLFTTTISANFHNLQISSFPRLSDNLCLDKLILTG